ncbi:MAG: hypothetical protein HGN29_04280 [Asgard group archaeon]|nr:hypothetical protein [Asgard group archaeon]
MSEKTSRKWFLIVVCILIAAGSIAGIIYGFGLMVWYGNAWIALSVVSIFLLFGDIFFIFKLTRKE